MKRRAQRCEECGRYRVGITVVDGRDLCPECADNYRNERQGEVMEETRLRLYVPVPGSQIARSILPGSAIVGREREDGVLIDYEGNKYGSLNLLTWQERVRSAWGRATAGDPTTARMFVPRSEVIPVGTCDGATIEVWKQDEIDTWLDEAGELKAWAAAFREEVAGELADRLVVVWAEDVEAARKRSGLIVEDFHEATDDELDEWNDALDAPWDPGDLSMLATMVRRVLRDVGRQRRRNRETGRWQADTPDAFDANRSRARRLTFVAAKLDDMQQEEVRDGDREAQRGRAA